MNKPLQKQLIPGTEKKIDGPEQDEREKWQQKILNERYPKVEMKDGGWLSPDEIAKNPEVWRG